MHLGLATIFCPLRVTKHFEHLTPFHSKAASRVIRKSQYLQGPAITLKESASHPLLILARNLRSTNEFWLSTLADVAWKWLSQAGAGSWERTMLCLDPSFSTGFPHLGHPQGVWLQESVNPGCLGPIIQSQRGLT